MPLERITEPAPRPDPVVHPETDGFWSRLAEGDLTVQVCSRCGTPRFPAAPVCYVCLSFDHDWQSLDPNGTVATAAVVHRATGDPAWSDHTPFASGLVDLDRGLRLPGRILCTCGLGTARGARVRAVVSEGPGMVPVHAFAHSCVRP
jgi:uncharacterized OB-fold protein